MNIKKKKNVWSTHGKEHTWVSNQDSDLLCNLLFIIEKLINQSVNIYVLSFSSCFFTLDECLSNISTER